MSIVELRNAHSMEVQARELMECQSEGTDHHPDAKTMLSKHLGDSLPSGMRRESEIRKEDAEQTVRILVRAASEKESSMKKLLIATVTWSTLAAPVLAQTTTTITAPSPNAPTSADRTVGAAGSERGNNASSLEWFEGFVWQLHRRKCPEQY
jgi:hypothetical protein